MLIHHSELNSIFNNIKYAKKENMQSKKKAIRATNEFLGVNI